MKEWFEKLNPTTQTIVVVTMVIILVLVYRELKAVVQRPRFNQNNIPVTGIGGGGQIVQWDPDPLAREIFENLEGWNFNVYPETAKQIVDLQTDDQVIMLYNHYNKNYAKDQPTLTKLIDKEWPDMGGYYKKAVARLRGLGLN